MFFLLLRARRLYPILYSDNHSETKNILQFQILKKKTATVHCTMQNMDFVKSGKLQNACASEYQN
jgi:hypothetical protein